MKKIRKPLALTTETIKQLDDRIRSVVGGIPGSIASHCRDEEGCSYSCGGTCWNCN